MLINKKKIKLIALDLDGTLLNSNLEISKSNQEAIAKAVAKGIHVMFSTGRPVDFCKPLIELLKLESYLITVSGGEIWSHNMELLERNIHDSNQFEKLWNLGKDKGVKVWMISTNREYGDEDQLNDFSVHEWLKIGYHSENEVILNDIKKELSLYKDLEIANSHPNNIEVSPKGVNKASGIEKVCRKLGITMDEVMAIGDSLNDLHMIKKSGLGVAMGNAQKRIKEVADYTTDTNDNDGVAKAIEQFVL